MVDEIRDRAKRLLKTSGIYSGDMERIIIDAGDVYNYLDDMLYRLGNAPIPCEPPLEKDFLDIARRLMSQLQYFTDIGLQLPDYEGTIDLEELEEEIEKDMEEEERNKRREKRKAKKEAKERAKKEANEKVTDTLDEWI